jgi:hypothetical protein
MNTTTARIKGLHSRKGTGESPGAKHPVRRLIAGSFLVVISAVLTVMSID